MTALGLIFGLASLTPMSIFLLNLATLLGLGLGVDYSLLMLSRSREELVHWTRPDTRADAEAVEAAVRVSVATDGRAVFYSGQTVLLGLLGLVLFEFLILRAVGIAGALVVGIAVAAALTLLPTLLPVLGSRVDALAIRQVRPAPASEGAWARLARPVMRRPLLVFFPALGLLPVLGRPFLHVRFNAPDATILSESVPSRASYETLVTSFGEGAFAPLTLAIRTDGPATDPANIARLCDCSRRLAVDPRVARVDSLADVDPRMGLAQYQILCASPGGPPDRFTGTVLPRPPRGT